MNANLYALFASRFLADREKPCFLCADGRVVSYGALEEGAGRMATLLARQGVAPGDRVAMQAPKSPEAIMLYLATLQLGAVFLPLNTAYTEAETAYFTADSEPRVFVRDARAFAIEAQAMPRHEDVCSRSDDDLAALVYTSGTTGRSKGAMLSHRALAANALALHAAWGFSPQDVLLHALPIFHVHGLFVALHCALLSGAPMIWHDKFDAGAVIAALPQATVLMGVPTFYVRLLEDPRFTRESAASVRLFVSGSAPLLESTFAAFEARIGQRILERYGMSEAVIITSNPLDGPRVPGSVGFPLPGVSLRIADGADTGPIEIKGESVCLGYWRNPEKTVEDFTADGWFRTGDVGRVDSDGRVWISGRAKDLVISGGFNVYPKEVELVLDELPGVGESAVIGVPHPDFGEAVVAVVAAAAGGAPGSVPVEGDLIAAARERLAAFKVPKRVVIVDDLPRNTMGKVLKAELRKQFGGLFGPPSQT